MKIILFICIILTCLTNTLAKESKSKNESHLNKLNFCKITPSAENDYEPETFETSNNLLREAGHESLFCGEKIIISGILLDENCIPVSDAKIYLWQVDCKGKYPYKPLKKNIDETLIKIDSRLTFTGNGVATTNNKGEFHFITVYPSGVHNLASHVNIRTEHYHLGTFQTQLILKGHKLDHPEYYPELNPINKIAVKNNISIYNYQIVIPGHSGGSY